MDFQAGGSRVTRSQRVCGTASAALQLCVEGLWDTWDFEGESDCSLRLPPIWMPAQSWQPLLLFTQFWTASPECTLHAGIVKFMGIQRATVVLGCYVDGIDGAVPCKISKTYTRDNSYCKRFCWMGIMGRCWFCLLWYVFAILQLSLCMVCCRKLWTELQRYCLTPTHWVRMVLLPFPPRSSVRMESTWPMGWVCAEVTGSQSKWCRFWAELCNQIPSHGWGTT